MVPLQRAAVCLGDFLVARRGAGLEHPVGLLEGHVRRARAAGPGRVPAAAAALDAQHRLDVRELERRDIQGRTHARHEGTHRTLEVVAGERGAHLDLEEDPRQVRAVPGRRAPSAAISPAKSKSARLPLRKQAMASRTCSGPGAARP